MQKMNSKRRLSQKSRQLTTFWDSLDLFMKVEPRGGNDI
jgi:hypothetical protein